MIQLVESYAPYEATGGSPGQTRTGATEGVGVSGEQSIAVARNVVFIPWPAWPVSAVIFFIGGGVSGVRFPKEGRVPGNI